MAGQVTLVGDWFAQPPPPAVSVAPVPDSLTVSWLPDCVTAMLLFSPGSTQLVPSHGWTISRLAPILTTEANEGWADAASPSAASAAATADLFIWCNPVL